MGQRSSGLAKGGGMAGRSTVAATAETGTRAAEGALVDDLAVAMGTPVMDIDDPTVMSRGDMEAAVEAFAMTHPGTDENALIKQIEDRINNVGATSNWETWKPGNSITYSASDFDSARRGSFEGTVTQVFSDHAIVNVPGISDHMWLDKDTAYQFKLRR